MSPPWPNRPPPTNDPSEHGSSLNHARSGSSARAGARLVSRRTLLGTAIAAGSCGRAVAEAQGAADKTLRILDAIGNLPLTELGFELYTKEHPDSFSRLKFDESPATKIADLVEKGAQVPGLLPDIVLVGADRMVEGAHNGSWQQLMPTYASRLPDLRARYSPAAWNMQSYADGRGLLLSYVVSGPVLVHLSSSTLPTRLKPAELLAWLRTNPGRFRYARPTTSRSGRDFLMSLPYMLGDAGPTDPIKGWERTWSFLAELGAHIEDYPLSVRPLIAGLEARSIDVIACTFGEIFSARTTAKSPLRIGAFDDGCWINDAQYAVIPKQVPPERTQAIVDVLAFMLSPKAQAFALRQGSSFPAAAIADVPADLVEPWTPDNTRAADEKEFASLTQGGRFVPSLFGPALTYALARWDRQIRLKAG